MKATIYLRSGAHFTVDVESLSTRRALGGDLVEMKWETPDGAAEKLHTIKLDAIDAITVAHEAEPATSDEVQIP